MIMESFDETEEAKDGNFITGIAGRKNFSVITITKNGMSNEVGVLRADIEGAGEISAGAGVPALGH